MATSSVIELIIQAKDLASKGINAVQASLNGMKDSGTRVSGGLNDLKAAGDKCSTAVTNVGAACTSLYGVLLRLAAVAGVGGLAKSFIDINSNAERTRIMLGSLYGSIEEGNKVFAAIQEEATKVPFSMSAIQDSFVKLKAAGIDPMNGSFRVLADSVAMFGGSDEELKSVMIAIQQMAGKGVISMEELRQQLGEKIPTAIGAMAKGMGMSMEQLSKEIESGSLSAAKGLNAMLTELGKTYGGQSQKMMSSWAGLISNVKVAWEQFIIKLGDSGVFDRLKNVITGVIAKIEQWSSNNTLSFWIENISTGLSFFIGLGAKAVTMLSEVWSWISRTDAFQSLSSVILAAAEAIKWLIEQLTGVFGWIQKVWAEVEQSTAWTTFKIVVSEVVTAVSDLFSRLIVGLPIISSLAGQHFGTTQRWIEACLNVLSLFLSGITKVVSTFVSLGEAVGTGAALIGPSLSKMADTVEILILKFEKLVLSVSSLGMADTSGIDRQIAALEKHKAGIEADINAMQQMPPAAAKTKTAMDALAGSSEKVATVAPAVADGLNKAADATQKSGQYMAENKRTYEEWLATVKPGTAEFIKMENDRLKALEQSSKAQKELYKQQYDDGSISAKRYYDLIQQLDDETYHNKLKNIEAQIMQLKQGGEKEFAQVAKVEGEKNALTAAYEAAKQKLAIESTAALKAELEKQVVNVADASTAMVEIEKKRHAAQIAAFTDYLTQLKELLNSLKDTISDAFSTEDVFSKLGTGFNTIKQILTADYKTMMADVEQYTKDRFENINRLIQYWGQLPMEKLYLFGRDVSALSSQQVSQWVESVTGYVQKVKDLFASLQDTIISYQDQLDQMRGNNMSVLERWYAEEIKKLKDKYGEDLKNTAEFQQALTLLEELYAEKRKKIFEDEQKAKQDYLGNLPNLGQSLQDQFNQTMGNPPGAPPSGSSGGNITQNIDITLGASMDVKSFCDPVFTERWIREQFLPILFNQLKLRGITLG